MASHSKALYIGFTGNLPRRIWEHKRKLIKGHTAKYNIHKLVYYEQTENVMSALDREKQLKKWSRIKKIKLIEMENEEWNDLYNEL